MPPYRFRLEPVRRVRLSKRDELRGALAEAFKAADTLAEQSRAVEAELRALKNDMTGAAGAESFDVNGMLDAQRYELVLKGQLRQLQEKSGLVEKEIERRRGLVVAAEREVKALDALDESGRERHRSEEEKLENKQADEVAGGVWRRSKTQQAES